MAHYSAIKAAVNAYIKQNGRKEITGRILNAVLNATIDSLGRYFQFAGGALPTDDPGTPDQNVCYLAGEPGVYTNFGGITIENEEVALLFWDGEWTKQRILIGIREVNASVDNQVGTPSVDVSYSGGELVLTFHNLKGEQGETGDPAGFGTIGADINGGVGTPGVSVETSGDNTAKNLMFHFTNLKGETGVTSVVATIDNTSGTPSCQVSLVGQQLTLAFSGLKGLKGDTGVSADYPITIYNGLDSDATDQALAAYQGKVLDGKIGQLEAKVDELALGNFLGFYPSAEDLPTDGNKPGFAYVGTESPYSIYNYDGTTWTDSGATVKRGEGQIIYLEDFPGYASDLSPVAMREFLQSAIDYVGQNKAMLIFPKGKTFTIDIPESHEDGRYDCEGGDGLKIPGNITIDFNYCTINIVPNHWYCYNILHILYDAENVTLKNGNIVGDRDNHIMSNTISQNVPVGTDEWNYAIMVSGPGKDILHNMTFSDVRGDGIYMDGESVWNHTLVINGANVLAGYDVDANGDLVSSTEHLTTVLLSISTYYTSKAHREGLKTYLVPRVAFDRSASNIEHSYYFKVSYYTEQDAFISAETVFMGDPMNIPTGAVKFRLTNWVADINNPFGFWVMNVLWNEHSHISNCGITRCGRNGIVPTTVEYLTISNCSISEIHGTNNQVAIDIEGTSYIQKHITIKDCDINNPGYSGIVVAQGCHINVENCKMVGCGFASFGDDVHLIRCSGSDIRQRLPESTVFETDLVYPRCTFVECEFSGEVVMEYSVASSCRFSGFTTRVRPHESDEKLSPIFENCELSQIGDILAFFNQCTIIYDNIVAFMRFSPTFVGSIIKCKKFTSTQDSLVKMYRCKLSITEELNTSCISLCTDRFIDNIVDTNNNIANNKISFIPGGDLCVIKGNKFIGAFNYNIFYSISSNVPANQVAKTFIFEENVVESSRSVNVSLFQTDSRWKDMSVSFRNNIIKVAGGTVKDFRDLSGFASSDKLKILTDNNLCFGGTFSETTNEHVFTATWTPSVTP